MDKYNMKTYPGSCSVIVSTYNWPHALALCLNALLRQEKKPDEIIIADDGSTDPTRQLIQRVSRNSPIPIKHIWHPDEGFRLAEIRNKAIAASIGEYIIQIDGDCIPHRFFVSDHLEIAMINEFVCGSRIRLDPQRSKQILKKGLDYLGRIPLSLEQHFAKIRITPLMHYLAPRYARRNLMRHRGCNMAFWRKDLIKVNGYNADFKGWGQEETDLIFRLVNAGLKKRILKFGGILFHLYHPEQNRSATLKNLQLAALSRSNGIIYTHNGIVPTARKERDHTHQ